MNGGEIGYFKSINLRQDIGHPGRFAHFFPTSKSVRVIDAIVNGSQDPATIIVASYGSGKSLAAGTAALAVENNKTAAKQLNEIAARLSRVDSRLGKHLSKRVKSKQKGMTILLEGYHENLAQALFRAAKENLNYLRAPNESAGVVEMCEAISKRATQQGLDRIAIIWDEFGQHLDVLADAGRAESLIEVQQIAEWSSRQKLPAATFTLLLHQNLSQYAGNLSQSSKSSWRKIEGRFKSISYVEDSNEIYELIAAVVKQLHPELKQPAVKEFASTADKARQAGLFKEFSGNSALSKILQATAPLHPAALYMLPRIASRLAQNERTVFNFLREADFNRRLSLLDVYQFFSSSMQEDSGPGGTHRRWLETESALSKVSEASDKEILAAAALLAIGVSGERARVRRSSLLFAVSGSSGLSDKLVSKAVDSLIKRKLLLYRKNNDDLSIWHGTDIDIRSRLRELSSGFSEYADIVKFLSENYPAPNWRPVAHNLQYSIRRYYQGRFVLASELLQHGSGCPSLQLQVDQDGAIVYILTESAEEINAAGKFARQLKNVEGNRLILVVPKEPLSVIDLVTEIMALRILQSDIELLSADPFMLPELQSMTEAAQENLAHKLGRLFQPDNGNNAWYASGRQLKAGNEFELQAQLSKFANTIYKHTPIINNELIVRRKVSRQMVNARKKLVLGILERSGQEDLGFAHDSTSAVDTLYRTTVKDKLYQCKEGEWVWVKPKKKQTQLGLDLVWARLDEFFTMPGVGKSFSALIEDLCLPPYGLRMGVTPILIAAAMKAFGRIFAIRCKDEYLPDVLASDIEAICDLPGDYSLDVLEFNGFHEQYFHWTCQCFGNQYPIDNDLVRELYDAINVWKARLPSQALTTRRVGKQGRKLQRILRGEVDPILFAMEQLPEIMGYKKPDVNYIPQFEKLTSEIGGIAYRYITSAIDDIRIQLSIFPNSAGNSLERASEWACCFTGSSVSDLERTENAVHSRALEANNGKYTEESFARAISAILIGKDFTQWDDASASEFSSQLRNIARSVEDKALLAPDPNQSLEPFLRRRIEYMKSVLKRLQVTPAEQRRLAGSRNAKKG